MEITSVILQGVERPKERGLKSLRTARKLEEGMVGATFTFNMDDYL